MTWLKRIDKSQGRQLPGGVDHPDYLDSIFDSKLPDPADPFFDDDAHPDRHPNAGRDIAGIHSGDPADPFLRDTTEAPQTRVSDVKAAATKATAKAR